MGKDSEKDLKKKTTVDKESTKKETKKKEKKTVAKKVKEKIKAPRKKKEKKVEVSASNEEMVVQDSEIRKKVMLLGDYLLEKLKDYKYVIALDFVVFLLLFYLIPVVILDVKPFIWMLAFVVFTVVPTIGIYGMNKFREKQIVFGFFFIYLLIFLGLKRFSIIELYGITARGNLDYTPAWLDAVFTTCIIVFFQYIGIILVNLVRKLKHKQEKLA